MDKIIEEICTYLRREYDCHTILLYGSYANGDYTDDSDIDIICFTDRECRENDNSIIGDIQLDVWIAATEELDKPDEYLHLLGCRILLDEKGKAEKFVTEIRKRYEDGTDPITEERRKFLKSWLTKMYRRSRRGDAEGAYRYHWMLTDSLEMYFEMKNQWFLGVKKSLKWLEANDDYAYKLFDSAFRSETGSEAAGKLIEYLVSEC